VVLYSGSPRWKDVVSGGLRDLGWAIGRDALVDWRSTAEIANLEMDLRHELQQPVDAFIMGGPQAIYTAMKVTDKVPIVGIDLESDPVARGFVKSLARPGKNVSGVWMDLPQLAGKQLQFLREVLPGLRRVGVVWDEEIGGPQWTEVQAAAHASNIAVHAISLHAPSEAEDVVRRLFADRSEAMLALTAPTIFRALPRLAELAIQKRLPSISPFSTYPESGGLMAYGPDFVAMYRQTSSYVDRIFKGANVGDLPVERPSKFVLIVNVKTSKALGLTIPQSLLLRADQVIE